MLLRSSPLPKPEFPSVGEPLAPFDSFMLADARRGYPMCFFLECLVEGVLEEERFRRAVREAVQRHPRLRSRAARVGGNPQWLVPDVEPALAWHPKPGESDPWRPIDLARESGLRIVVRATEERRHSIVLVVHHAACDGIAACEFIGDVWACYAGVPPRQFSRMPPREDRRAEPSAPGPPPPDVSFGDVLSFARFWPTALAMRQDARRAPSYHQSAAPDGDAPLEPPYATIELDAASTAALRSAATAHRATVNDLIVAAVMRACVAWNERLGKRRGHIRVTMPVSIRPPGERTPARNGISYAFLDRSDDACRDADALVASLAAASRWILSSGVVGGFLQAVGFLARTPWLLGAVTRVPSCFSTVVVSNLGDVGRRMRAGVAKVDGREAPGGLQILGFRGVPPLRPKTRAAIGVLTYARTTSICCLCAAGPEPRAAAEEFLELVRQQLKELSGLAAATPAVRTPPRPGSR